MSSPELPGMPRSANDMLPSELLTATLAYIEKHGWAQNVGIGDNGEACALVAAQAAALGGSLRPGVYMSKDQEAKFTEVERALERVAGELVGHSVSVPAFNDRTCRDRTDVEAWIEKARAQLEEQGR